MHNNDYRNGITELEFTEHKNKGCKHTDMQKEFRNGFYIFTCKVPSCKKVMSQIEYINHKAEERKRETKEIFKP